MTIRTRITLFGLGVVAAGLVLFCIVMYILLAAGVRNTQDQALAERARQAAASLAVAQRSDLLTAATGPVLAPTDPRISTDVFVIVLGPQGTVLAGTGAIDGAVPAVPSGLLAAAEARGSARGTVEAAPGVQVRLYVRPWQRSDGTRGYVAAAQTTRRVEADRLGIAVLVVVSGFLAFGAAAVAIWVVTGRALRPLRQLAVLVDEIGRAPDLGRRLPPVATRDALGHLTSSFNAMMERLQTAYRRQADSLAAQQRFTADASHELRTPLTTVRNNAGFLLRHPDAAAADRLAAVRDIVGEAERMSRLVASLLTLARADAGQRLSRSPVDLAELAETVCRRGAALYPGRQVHCAVTPTPAVAGDADALAQLLWILLDNAVKHTSEGGNIWVAVTQRGELAQVHVSDDGCGIPVGEQGRIFDRFYRADPARSGPGAGLGLSIAQWIANAHGGHILAANNARGGASFAAELPTVPREPVATTAELHPVPRAPVATTAELPAPEGGPDEAGAGSGGPGGSVAPEGGPGEPAAPDGRNPPDR
jgi:two-component system OmpR family sensor kinase